MTYSRRQLYAAGEPLGECVTRQKPEGGYVCGSGASGSSLFGSGGDSDNSNKTATTTSTDNSQHTFNRVQGPTTADGGGIALGTGDITRSSLTINTLDGGAIQAGADLSKTALKTNSDNTRLLLDAAAKLNENGFDMLKAGSNWATHIIDSTQAQNQAAMQVVANVVSKPLDMQDPKNILVAAGVAAVAIVAVIAMKKA